MGVKERLHSIRHTLYLYKKYFSLHKNHVFIIGEPRHGNIGDSAIAVAMKSFINKAFDGNCVISDVFFDDYNYDIGMWDKLILKKDIICLLGGGNLGDLWYEEEMFKEEIIKRFPNNKIIIFPQTMLFKSEEKLKTAINVYNSHPDLTVVARENKSYDDMMASFTKCKVLLTPDIVLSMSDIFDEYANVQKDRIGLVLRSDQERSLNDDSFSKLVSYLNEKKYSYDRMDMVDPVSITIENRFDLIRNKLKAISSHKLIITDRLHAMVFSALTGTPCIVFGNNHHKVSGCYEWIKSLEHIRLVASVDDAISMIDGFYDYPGRITRIDLEEKYLPLKNAICN